MPHPDRKDFMNERFEHYLTLKPQSFKHERFILNRLKRLQNDMDNTGNIGSCNNCQSLEVVQKRSERFC